MCGGDVGLWHGWGASAALSDRWGGPGRCQGDVMEEEGLAGWVPDC